MAVRQRAIQLEDKQERRDAILDAAERVLLCAPERVASVAEVAGHAGLAKGTVYLYFASKEELLLAVHERRVEGFFGDLIGLVEAAPSVDFDALFALARAHLINQPLFLPLAAHCFGLMAHSLPAAVVLAFKQRMACHLERAGAGLERHFPVSAATLAPGCGLALLRRSYALIIGLWQMSAACGAAPDPSSAALPVPQVPPAFAWPYIEEVEDALRALWRGVIVTLDPAAPATGDSL